ncbi:hydrogenase [Geomonas sp. RF6]|uniref:proton-conducting transporter transmembrane domain-containing protein n=1 Tax=Geomonas sp. RF6 TaxID=2897342 RepID=UPI001E34A923|nr:proton-conducting transporter membrane subunit [Geomonas sp. RF6]UFS68789.1 hydrogenase [Geomonas sp. RF6]
MLHNLMRDPSLVVLISITLVALSGAPGLLIKKQSLGQRIATAAALLASLLALPSIVFMLLTGASASYLLALNLPFGECLLGLDPLSLSFLIPIFVVFPCGSLYANGYWPSASHRSSEPPLTFFYGLLAAAMALVVVARNGAFFLMFWEVMALSGFFLLMAEHDKGEVRRAGVVYLVASHVGVAALFLLFSLLRFHTGSFLFPARGALQHVDAVIASVIFFAALAGFGSKAGIMPLHIWLPSAHANAPSHVSAILSGVMLKMGIYGILRTLSFLPQRPLWWGAVLLVAGLSSALFGICAASLQSDIKRLLAYSSIENVGIIAAAIGVALIGEATHADRLALLGLTAALLHTLNHSLFKPLLFFCAGSVMHATGTRSMDRMGGLAKRMPWSTLAALCGAVAICGLPPFNGFVSEFFLYVAFFGEAMGDHPYLTLGAPVLALVGGIAVLSLVKLFGATFLGSARSERGAACHEAPLSMLLPMGFLALLCAGAGVYPQAPLALVAPVLAAVPALAPVAIALPIDPRIFAWGACALLLTGGTLALFLRWRTAQGTTSQAATWGCGYLRPTSRMQYSATSFSEFLASLTSRVTRTTVRAVGVEGYAPGASRLEYEPEETVLDRGILPAFRMIGKGFYYMRKLQHGQVQLYMLYMFVALVLLMVWVR